MNMMEKRNTELIKEFNAYIREHPEFADNIPNQSIVIMQLEGGEEFNKWSSELTEAHKGEGRPVVYVRIKRMSPFVHVLKNWNYSSSQLRVSLGMERGKTFPIFLRGELKLPRRRVT
jgi:hypothetical protein